MKRILAILVLVAACSGCDQKAERAFFGSIKLGMPEWTNGVCMLPVELPTAIIHSAMWVSGVESRVDGSNILVTARVRHHAAQGIHIPVMQSRINGEFADIAAGQVTPLRVQDRPRAGRRHHRVIPVERIVFSVDIQHGKSHAATVVLAGE